MRRSHFKRALFLFLAGALLLGISVYWNLSQTIQLAYFTPHVIPVKKSHPIPITITIPSVNVTLPIEETAINNGVWQIAENGASHLTISARPGEDGPIIMYGHNTNVRFGRILSLKNGNKILIKTADDKIHQYKIIQTRVVSSTELDVLTQKPGESLILYTCTGFADWNRFVVIAVPYEGFIFK